MTARIDRKIGFVGGGNMAEAIIRSLLDAGLCLASDIRVSDTRRERSAHLHGSFGVEAVEANGKCVAMSDIVILAIKPQNMGAVLDELSREGISPGRLVLSIAAGITTASIERALGGEAAVVRVMPNTPALIGEGMSIWARGSRVGERDAEYARCILGALGKEIEVGEELMNAATALSGSGPAYVFYLLEAMEKAGEELGFTAAQALAISTQTVIGAARLVETSAQHPDELRRKVTSPGGTTAAAIRVLDEKGVRKSFIAAIKAACARADELSKI
ncbi:MAG: pyrroline-5-carboxylate reductase [Chlamydiota bacterium]